MNKKWMATCGLLALFAIGCADDSADAPPVADGHDHDHDHGHGHDHPESFKAAVEKASMLRDKIRDGFANEDPDAAHGPLHDVGDVLGSIAAMAEKEGLEGETLTGVRDAVETLKESFGSVDKMMHGGEGSEYSEVSADVDAAMATLVAAAAGAEDHDHDHDGHEEGHDDHEEGHEGHDHEEDGHEEK